MAVTILDGGLGQELVHRAGDRPTPLWSTQVMRVRPGLVAEVHRDFLAAGAEVIATNTYCVLRDRLRDNGIEDQFETLMEAALAQAEAARAAFPGARIGGSLGPLRASYRPDLCPSAEDAAAEYAELVALMQGRVDLFLIETMSSLLQAEGALRAATGQGAPVWLGMTVDDADGTRLRSGEPLEALAQLIEEYRPDAVLLNCSRPEAVSQGLRLVAGFGVPFGAYANGFTRISDGFKEAKPTVEALQTRVDLDPAAYADFATAWAEMGASIIGGCCEVGPAHIAELKRRLG